MTSAGDHIVWPAYGAVSAAKSALESHIRQIAVELAPRNITANAIRAGVTDTPALRKIPGNEAMIERRSRASPGPPADDPAGRGGRSRRPRFGTHALDFGKRDRRGRRRRHRRRRLNQFSIGGLDGGRELACPGV